MTEVRPGAWRLRVYVSRRSNDSPIQIRKTVEAKIPDSVPADGWPNGSSPTPSQSPRKSAKQKNRTFRLFSAGKG